MAFKILIVDDSPAMQKIMTRALRAIGFDKANFFYADDGNKALQLAKQVKPELALCDLHMPEMDGINLIREISKSNLPTKTGIVSIDRNQSIIDEALAAGASFYLEKPYTYKQLTDTIARHTGINPLLIERRSLPSGVRIPNRLILENFFTFLLGTRIQLEETTPCAFSENQVPFLFCTYSDTQHHLRAHLGFTHRAALSIAQQMKRISARELEEQLTNRSILPASEAAIKDVIGLAGLLMHGKTDEDTLSANDLYLSGKGKSTAARAQLMLEKLKRGLHVYRFSGDRASDIEGFMAIGPM